MLVAAATSLPSPSAAQHVALEDSLGIRQRCATAIEILRTGHPAAKLQWARADSTAYVTLGDLLNTPPAPEGLPKILDRYPRNGPQPIDHDSVYARILPALQAIDDDPDTVVAKAARYVFRGLSDEMMRERCAQAVNVLTSGEPSSQLEHAASFALGCRIDAPAALAAAWQRPSTDSALAQVLFTTSLRVRDRRVLVALIDAAQPGRPQWTRLRAIQTLVNFADSGKWLPDESLPKLPEDGSGLASVTDLGDDGREIQPLDLTTRAQVIAAMWSLRGDADPVVARVAQFVWRDLSHQP